MSRHQKYPLYILKKVIQASQTATTRSKRQHSSHARKRRSSLYDAPPSQSLYIDPTIAWPAGLKTIVLPTGAQIFAVSTGKASPAAQDTTQGQLPACRLPRGFSNVLTDDRTSTETLVRAPGSFRQITRRTRLSKCPAVLTFFMSGHAIPVYWWTFGSLLRAFSPGCEKGQSDQSCTNRLQQGRTCNWPGKALLAQFHSKQYLK